MCALIAFDLDDTLYKERDYVASGLRAVAHSASRESGLPSEELEELLLGAPDGHAAFDALEARLRGAGVDYPVWRMVAEYRNHVPAISPDPEVEAVLAELKRRGHTLALITDGNPVRQHAKVSALRLDRYFDTTNIIVSADTGSDKTTPLPFAQAERLVRGQRRYYVGDNPAKDFHWPNLRGWHTVMLRDADGLNIHPQHTGPLPAQYRAATTIDNLHRLLDL